MNLRDQMKVIKRALARYGLYLSSWLINHLSYPTVRTLTHFFIAVGFRCAIKQQKIARESLSIAFQKEKPSEEISRIARDCFENLGKGMIELIYFMDHP